MNFILYLLVVVVTIVVTALITAMVTARELGKEVKAAKDRAAYFQSRYDVGLDWYRKTQVDYETKHFQLQQIKEVCHKNIAKYNDKKRQYVVDGKTRESFFCSGAVHGFATVLMVLRDEDFLTDKY